MTASSSKKPAPHALDHNPPRSPLKGPRPQSIKQNLIDSIQISSLQCLFYQVMDSKKPIVIESENQLRDIESQVSTERKHWWSRRNWWFERKANPEVVSIELSNRPTNSVASIRSGRLSIPRIWGIGPANTSRVNTLVSHPDSSKAEAQDLFLQAITKEKPVSAPLELSGKWYTQYLESKVRQFWVKLFRPVLANVDRVSGTPNEDDISQAFRFLEVIVGQLEKDVPGGLALTDIIDELYNTPPLRCLVIPTDRERSHARLLVFATFGWMSCLYTPKYIAGSKNFEIHDPFQNSLGRMPSARVRTVEKFRFPFPFRQRQERDAIMSMSLLPGQSSSRNRSKIFTNFHTPFDHWDQPLHTVIRSFGNTIPQRRHSGFSGHETPRMFQGEPEERIEFGMVNFDALCRVGRVEVEWVDCLNLHLEFDSRTRILRLFKNPSLCLIMGSRENSTLHKIFASPNISQFGIGQEKDAHDFFSEVIMSYRLLFGQRKSAYNRFNKLQPLWQSMLQENSDPLLHILCGQSWKTRDALAIFDKIDVEDPVDHFRPSELFPFLGYRLSVLQKHIQGRNPSTFGELWHNDTNKMAWWTFWAVFVIGGGGLILGVAQAVLSVLQVVYTKHGSN